MKETEIYNHHGRDVHVISELKGKHREHCLCFQCEKFNEDRSKNCHIANKLFKSCVRFGVVTPVYECPEYVRKADAGTQLPS